MRLSSDVVEDEGQNTSSSRFKPTCRLASVPKYFVIARINLIHGKRVPSSIDGIARGLQVSKVRLHGTGVTFIFCTRLIDFAR